MPTALIVSASPLDQDRLRLGAEVRDIRHALKRSRNREEWVIETNEAITVDDLRALLDSRPTIVHFSGHGAGAGGLCFEDADGNTHATDAESLAKLFHHFKDSLKCVVLNACFSDVQGKAISKEIDYVIGMNSAVEDDSAIKFAVAFYDAMFAGTDFRTGFDLGCTALDLNNLSGSSIPIFMTGAHLQPSVLAYSAHVPEIERILHAYFNSPYAERAKFTTTGEPLTPVLVKYYAAHMHRKVEKIQVSSMKLVEPDQWCVELRTGGGHQLMYVRVRNRVVQVEWEASVGLWSIPPKTYLALGPSGSVVARVKAELGDSYYGPFREEIGRFQAINVFAQGETLNAYVERNTEVHLELVELLFDGNEHSITLLIRNLIADPKMPVIEKVLSKSWIYTPDTGIS
jgi:hypothetical protein